MLAWKAETMVFLIGSAFMSCSPLLSVPANASSAPDYTWTSSVGHVTMKIGSNHSGGYHGVASHAIGGLASGDRGAPSSGISCVPYAREMSGIQVAGNAWQWWDNSSGRYARGDRPEAGSVLTFRSNNRMRLGHVAVVARVVNAREVIVNHANWPSTGMRGGVSRGVSVVDVSEANNWSAVRVQLSQSDDFGSVYPTYGFIYNRPDNGVMVAKAGRPAPLPAINRVPSDLRPAAERPWHTVEEVAEAPAGPPRRRIDLRLTSATGNP